MWERCKACLPYTFPRWEDRPCSFLRLLSPLYVRLNPFLLLFLFSSLPPTPTPFSLPRHDRFCLFFSVRLCTYVWENLCVRSFSKREKEREREKGGESKLQLYVAPIFSSFLIPRSFILRQHVVWKKLPWLLAIDINEFLILVGRWRVRFQESVRFCAFVVNANRENVRIFNKNVSLPDDFSIVSNEKEGIVSARGKIIQPRNYRFQQRFSHIGN